MPEPRPTPAVSPAADDDDSLSGIQNIMAQIDIQITFDAQTIVETYGHNTDPQNPVQVDTKFIYMVTAQDDAVSGEGGGELTVYAQTEDELRWREAALGPDFSAILYQFVPTQGGDLISTPVPLEAEVTVPLPNPSDPTNPGRQTIEDYYWSSDVQNAGEVTYHFYFMVVSRAGDVLGYYWWDPFISISS